MIKKLIKVSAVLGISYIVYDAISRNRRNIIRVDKVPTEDILEMLEELEFKVLVGYDEKVLHFIKDDKSEAIQARVDEDYKVFLIEYYHHQDGIKVLENVYPENVILDNEGAKKARISFLRMLGSIGVTEHRFNQLVNEVLLDSSLADLTI